MSDLLHGGTLQKDGITWNIAFRFQVFKQTSLRIEYKISNGQTFLPPKELGKTGADNIEWDESLKTGWRKYLRQDGKWIENMANWGRAKRSTTLQDAWMAKFGDPREKPANNALNASTSIKRSPAGKSKRSADGKSVNPNNGVKRQRGSKGDGDSSAIDTTNTEQCFNGTIITKARDIPETAYKEISRSSQRLCSDFLAGQRKPGWVPEEGFLYSGMTYIESAFLKNGFRIEPRSAYAAHRDVESGKANSVIESTSWKTNSWYALPQANPAIAFMLSQNTLKGLRRNGIEASNALKRKATDEPEEISNLEKVSPDVVKPQPKSLWIISKPEPIEWSFFTKRRRSNE